MNKKIIFYISMYHIKRWKSRYHMIMGLIYFIILGDMMLRPTKTLIYELGVKPTTFAFPLLWNSTIFLMMFFFGVILLFSDSPFHDDMTPFFLIRCGNKNLTAAHIIYIIMLSFLIPICFFVIQAILFMPSLENNWGKFWGTLAQTNASLETGSRIEFKYHILWDFEPWEATVVVLFICILLCMLTGLLLYLTSILHIKTIGICILSGFIILPHIVDGLNFTTFYWLSPYSWICLNDTMRQYNGSLPSIGYAFFILITLVIFLICFIFLKTSHQKEIL